MLDKQDEIKLKEIIRFCERIEYKINGVNFETFINNNDLIEIISFNILQIGETAKKLSNDFMLEYNKIPWKLVKGMRDLIAHSYGSVNYKLLYNTAKKDIVELHSYCSSILENEGI